jgi:hypothetical protein
VRFRIALKPRNKTVRAPLLQPGQARVIIDLRNRPESVLGNPTRVSPQRPPYINEPPVKIIDRLDPAAPQIARQQHRR